MGPAITGTRTWTKVLLHTEYECEDVLILNCLIILFEKIISAQQELGKVAISPLFCVRVNEQDDSNKTQFSSYLTDFKTVTSPMHTFFTNAFTCITRPHTPSPSLTKH